MKALPGCLSLIICLYLVFATVTNSSPLGAECPAISVETPSSIICPDARVTFTAGVTGGGAVDNQLKFHWTVSSGKITSGQGTRTITVATVDEYGHSSDDGVQATVEVIGLNASCSSTASVGVRVNAFCPDRKLDEYGDLPFAEERVRLENFINRLQSNADTFGLIIIYTAERQRVSEADERATLIRDYLVNLRGIASERVITKDGGLREALTVELWMMPTKRPAYTNSPSANSTEPPLNAAPLKQQTP